MSAAQNKNIHEKKKKKKEKKIRRRRKSNFRLRRKTAYKYVAYTCDPAESTFKSTVTSIPILFLGTPSRRATQAIPQSFPGRKDANVTRLNYSKKKKKNEKKKKKSNRRETERERKINKCSKIFGLDSYCWMQWGAQRQNGDTGS